MIETRETIDSRSLEITREGKHIGYIQWHDTPRIVLSEAFNYLTLSELEHTLLAYERKTGRKRPQI